MADIAEVAQRAARVGGEIVARHYREGAAVRSKEASGEQSYNLVSDADFQSERAIAEVIRRAFPEHSILAEEEHQHAEDAEHLWVVDPLDGTNNFAHGIPHFAVSVAYCRDGETRYGAVFNPVRGDWYIAERGKGATHNGTPLAVADARSLDEVIVGLGFYYDRGAMMEATLAALADLFRLQIHGMRRFGTAALDLCHVAAGQFGAFFEYELSPWDFAAARLFVEEAGGTVTTCDGKPLVLQKSSVLATNGHLHQAVLEVVARHLPEAKKT